MINYFLSYNQFKYKEQMEVYIRNIFLYNIMNVLFLPHIVTNQLS